MVYCQFCSYSNCKDCSKKTRLYPGLTQSKGLEVSSSVPSNNPLKLAEKVSAHKKEKELLKESRGKICKVCDRKFFIREMLLQSSKQIKMQNLVI
jgi:hypothetical protein